MSGGAAKGAVAVLDGGGWPWPFFPFGEPLAFVPGWVPGWGPEKTPEALPPLEEDVETRSEDPLLGNALVWTIGSGATLGVATAVGQFIGGRRCCKRRAHPRCSRRAATQRAWRPAPARRSGSRLMSSLEHYDLEAGVLYGAPTITTTASSPCAPTTPGVARALLGRHSSSWPSNLNALGDSCMPADFEWERMRSGGSGNILVEGNALVEGAAPGGGGLHKERGREDVGRLVAAMLLRHTLAPDAAPGSAAIIYRMLCEGSSAQSASRWGGASGTLPRLPLPHARLGVDGEGPSEQELTAIFDAADADRDGTLDRGGLVLALRLIEDRCTSCPLRLEGDGIDRLQCFLRSASSGLVSREAFVRGIRGLSESASALGGLSLRELQDVLYYAFERLDRDRDGRISREEFSRALFALGLRLELAAESRLYAFLDADGDGFLDSSLDTSAWRRASELETWAGAFRVAMDAQFRRRGLDKVALVAEALPRRVKEAEHPLESALRVFGALFDFPEQVVDLIDLAMDVAAVLLALHGVGHEVSGADSLGAVDIGNMAPFLLFLGISGLHMAREVSETGMQDLTAEEALLYVRVFQRHGFSVAEFRALLKDCNAQWLAMEPGASLDEVRANHLVMLATGQVGVHDREAGAGAPCLAILGPGAAFGATMLLTGRALWQPGELRVTEPASCLSMDLEQLRRRLDRGDAAGQRLAGLLAECMAVNRRAVAAARRAAVKQAASRLPELGGCAEAEARLKAGDVTAAHAAWDSAFYQFARTPLVALGEEDRDLLRLAAAVLGVSRLDASRPEVAEDASLVSELLSGRAPPPLPLAGGAGRGPGGEGPAGEVVASKLDEVMLSRAFDDASSSSGFGREHLALEELRSALRLVDRRCQPGLLAKLGPWSAEEALDRVAASLARDAAASSAQAALLPGTVSRGSFIAGVQDLWEGLQGLNGLSIGQLQQILSCALKRFDENGDGRISLGEFEAALVLLGVRLPRAAVRALHSLLDTDGDGFIDAGEDLPGGPCEAASLERLAGAFQTAMQEQYRRKGFDKIAANLQSALMGASNPLEKLQHALGVLAGAELMSELMVGVCDAGAFGASVNALIRELSGLDSWADLDLSRIAPFLVFMGLSGAYMIRDLAGDSVSDLNEDEALLYASVFRRHGFSRLEFRQLLRQADARWERVPKERVVEGVSAGVLGFVVRGRCRLPSDASSPSATGKPRRDASAAPTAGLGTAIGEAAFLAQAVAEGGGAPNGGVLTEVAVLEEGALVVWWDAGRLEQHLALSEATAAKFRAALSEAAAAKLLASKKPPRRRGGAEVRLRLVAAAYRCRQGFAGSASEELDSALEALLGRLPGETPARLARTLQSIRQARSGGPAPGG